MSKNLTPEEKEAKILMNVLAQSQANLNQQKKQTTTATSSSSSNAHKITITPEFQTQMNIVRKKIKNREYNGLSKEALHKKLRKNVEPISDPYFNLLLKIFFEQQGGKKKTRKRTSKKRKTRKASR